MTFRRCVKTGVSRNYRKLIRLGGWKVTDDSFAMDFINHGDKIIYCAMYLYVSYINEATNLAENQGDGGNDTKD